MKTQRKKKSYHLRIPSQTDNLEIIREFVARVARKVGFREDDANKIELAVDEACTNVIEHAYDENEKKPIDIVIQIDSQKLSVTITDHGRGFDPDKIKPPNMADYLAEMRVGGLGIHLMHSLMDKIDFQVKKGRKNQVTMVKYFMDHQRDK